MDDKLIYARNWLIHDQYDFGEFGKHEISNPTDLPRTFETSLMKPNIFSSIYAYCTLISTGEVPEEVTKGFNDWISKIRDKDGYWTSASGALMPIGNRSGWAKNKNLRHTAKCLDFYFLFNQFRFQDAVIFDEIISKQLECGAYPQFIGGQPDIWSTAYFINLLIRSSMDSCLSLTLPRGNSPQSWKNELNNRLNSAIDWIISQISPIDKLWHIDGGDPVHISLAMMAEIGGYIAIHRHEQCKEIVSALIRTKEYNYSLLYISCLAIDILEVEEQKVILETLDDMLMRFEKKNLFLDLIDATSFCKLLFYSKNIGAIKYHRNISNGHESLLISPRVWDNNEYFRWCLRYFIEGKTSNFKSPILQSDFWEQIKKYIQQIKNGIENSRGWELLWNDNSPRDEKSVQVYFDNQLRIICEETCTSFSREAETGRGPIDFTFSNGFKNKHLIEIKLATNQALSNGDFCAQIYEYLKGLKAYTAFLVVVGYYEKHNEIMDKVNAFIGDFHDKYSQLYIYAIYINAQRRVGASKATFTNLKDS